MENMKSAFLEFHPERNQIDDEKKLSFGLSVSVLIDKTLWVANDETITLERLSFKGKDNEGNYFYGEHEKFLLSDFITLPVPPSFKSNGKMKFKEVDIEGLDFRDGYLWLVGSHSAKRPKLDSNNSDNVEEMLDTLSMVKSDGNRFILARIPLEKEGDNWIPKKISNQNGKVRFAAVLANGIVANERISLQNDKHLGIFLNIPSKDNGFDIEGLAVFESKVFVGLRGPVLRGWTVILELEIEKTNQDSAQVLKLERYKKHVLQLAGLGIRDLCVHGSDLLILAGPTMDLDGPVMIYRWEGGVNTENESVVFSQALRKVVDIPFGIGQDHAEGITLFSSTGDGKPDSILVVYDSASKDRQIGASSLKADVFPLVK